MIPALGWLGILRLGLVQTALGAIVVMTTSTINRVMVVELALPATLPGLLVALHYAVQVLRPRLGYGSDMGGRRTPWIVGGMAVLATGGIGAAAATALMAAQPVLGIGLAVLAFLLVGLGVGAAGTSLLVLLAERVAPGRRPAAASIVWIMMIAGFVLTTAIAGQLLDPYSPARLLAVTAGVAALACLLALAAVWRIEPPRRAAPATAEAKPAFRAALAQVWAEPEARHFTIFVFVAMLAYSAQDLILEPFAGEVFGLTLGQTTGLSSVQHGGVLLGMVLIALLGSFARGATQSAAQGADQSAPLRGWILGGCLAGGAALLGLAAAAMIGGDWPLRASYFALGVANGIFAAAAIATMMQLAGRGRDQRQGVRMGLWGAAQAVAFGLGGLAGTVLLDIGRSLLGAAPAAYAAVFIADAALFLLAAGLALRIGRVGAAPRPGYPDFATPAGRQLP